jgi:hypothetical protein
MWKAIGKGALKFGVWCIGHRGEIEAMVQAILAAKAKG